MYEDALLDALISPEVFAGLPLIIWQDLKIADVEVPMMGTIRTDEYFDAVHFRINNCNPSTVNYSYGGKKLEVKDMEYKEGKLHFSIPLELGVKTLLIYFDDQPALGYRIQ